MALVLVWRIARKEAKEGATRNVALNEESPKSQRRRTVKVIVGEHSRPAWGISSAGRAPALQAGCQEFESPILHRSFGNVRGCSSAVEHLLAKEKVEGSNPFIRSLERWSSG